MITITVSGADYDVPSSAADTNWAAAQVAFEQALAAAVNAAATAASVTALTARVAALEAPLTWHDLTLLGDWGGHIQYAKDVQGRVWIRGQADSPTNGTAIGVLPSGYRPPLPVSMVIPDPAGAIDVLKIAADGTFACTDGSASPEFQLSTIVFDTQSITP